MGVIFASGWENNEANDGGKWDNTVGTPVTNTASKWSGTYGFEVDATDEYVRKQVLAPGSTDDIYFQCRFRVETTPNALDNILVFEYAHAVTTLCSVAMTDARQLRLYDSAGSQVGSTSGVLDVNAWYELRVFWDRSERTATVWYAPITGTTVGTPVQVASGVVHGSLVTLESVVVGDYAAVGATTLKLWYDDVIVANDAFVTYTGLVHLRPNADGDNNAWTQGDLGVSNYFEEIDEVTPDNATTFLQTIVDGALFDQNIEAPSVPGIPSGARCPFIMVEGKHRIASGTTAHTFRWRFKSQASGTVANGSTLSHNDITWKANGDALPRLGQLILTTDPQDSTAIYDSDLTSAQIGCEAVDTDATSAMQVTAMWLLVVFSTPTTIAMTALKGTAARPLMDVVPGTKTIAMDALAAPAARPTMDVVPGLKSIAMAALLATAGHPALDVAPVTTISMDALGADAIIPDLAVSIAGSEPGPIVKFVSGFENNDDSDGGKWDTVSNGASIDVGTAYKNTGIYGMRANISASAAFLSKQYEDNAYAGDVYLQFRFWIQTPPSGTGNTVVRIVDNLLGQQVFSIRLTNNRTLQLFGSGTSPSQIGSNSSALNATQWFEIRAKYQRNANTVTLYYASLNANNQPNAFTQVATGSTLASHDNANFLSIGAIDSIATQLYYDDVMVLGDRFIEYTGIVHLRPDADGDANQWDRSGGGFSNFWDDIEEFPPNDNTNYLTTGTINERFEENIGAPGAAGIGTGAKVHFLLVEGRQRGAGASQFIDNWLFKTTSGNASGNGPAISHASTVWHTNGNVAPKTKFYFVKADPVGLATLYDSHLTGAQIGALVTSLSTNPRVTNMWALVVFANAQTIAMDALAATATVPTMDVVPGPVSVAMDALGAPATVPVLDVVPVTTVSMDALAAPATVPILDVVPGAVSITMDALVAPATPPLMDVVPGLKTITMDALVGATAVPVLDVVPGAKSIAMDALAAPATVPILDVVPGAVSIAMDVLVGVGTIPTMDVVAGITINMDALAGAATIPALDVVPVTVLQMDALVAPATVPTMDVVPGLRSVAMDALVGTGTVPTMDVVVGAIVPMDALAASAVLSALDVVPGAVSIAMDALVAPAAIPTLDVVPVTTITMDALVAPATVPTMDVVPVTSIAMDALVATAARPTMDVVPGATSVAVDALAAPAVIPRINVLIEGEILMDALGAPAVVPALDVVPGAVSITMDALVAPATVPTMDVVPVTSIAMDALVATAVVPTLDVVPGPVSVAMDALAASSAIPALDVVPTRTIAMDPLQATASPQVLDVVPGARSIAMDPPQATAVIPDIGVFVGGFPQTIAMDALVVTANIPGLDVVPTKVVAMDALVLAASVPAISVVTIGTAPVQRTVIVRSDHRRVLVTGGR